MPPITYGSSTQYVSKKPTFDEKFDYEYPLGLDLKPGSKLHDSIRDKIMERAFKSYNDMSKRHKTWNEIDHTLTAYINIDEFEKQVKDGDDRKPVSIVFPYSYTILETLLSYFTGAFIQDPMFRYEGVGPKDVIGAILLEKIIAIQCIQNKVGLNLHTFARDSFAYGFGAATPVWRNEYGLNNEILFEGNGLDNIDPYLYLPDTTVPTHDVQSGEYTGWIHKTNYLAYLKAEQNDASVFNVKYLGKLKDRISVLATDNSGRNTKSGSSNSKLRSDGLTNNIEIIRMYINLIPKDWELGTNEYPELWYFEIGQGEIVLKAQPAGLNHSRYPVVISAPDFDGYSCTPISRIEILNGMQGVLDFLFNSHVTNVRKAINDMIIYDPYLVNSKDLENPSAGKLIRLRRPGWGRGVQNVAQQLQINDVTRQNMSDSTFLVNWMDRVSGADSSMQGALRSGGPDRLTGVEFNGTRAGGVSRLERVSKVIGLQAMQDLGVFFGLHNQQFMREETYVKIAGEWQDVLTQEFGQTVERGRIPVSREALDIRHRTIVRDGSVPGGNYSDSWVQLFGILGQNPELAQNFDVVRIFTHIARNMGAKDVTQFVRRGGNIQPKLMTNEGVMQQMQAGNLQPMEALGQ